MQELWTIGRILKWTEQYFKQKNIEPNQKPFLFLKTNI